MDFLCVLQKERVKDFKTVIIKYLESLVQTQQQVSSFFITYFITYKLLLELLVYFFILKDVSERSF